MRPVLVDPIESPRSPAIIVSFQRLSMTSPFRHMNNGDRSHKHCPCLVSTAPPVTQFGRISGKGRVTK
jgi:hypothetical protein